MVPSSTKYFYMWMHCPLQDQTWWLDYLLRRHWRTLYSSSKFNLNVKYFKKLSVQTGRHTSNSVWFLVIFPFEKGWNNLKTLTSEQRIRSNPSFLVCEEEQVFESLNFFTLVQIYCIQGGMTDESECRDDMQEGLWAKFIPSSPGIVSTYYLL